MHKGIGGLVAAIGVSSAFAAAPAPAQAQENVQVCPGEYVPTGVPTIDRCTTVNPRCVGKICVTGVQENVDAAVALAWGAVGTVVGLVPDPICTPNLLAGPICVNH